MNVYIVITRKDLTSVSKHIYFCNKQAAEACAAYYKTKFGYQSAIDVQPMYDSFIQYMLRKKD